MTKHQLNRKDFLKISGAAATGVILSSFISPAWARKDFIDFPQQLKDKPAELLILDTDAPVGTTAVRYFIDHMQVAELTNLYAQQTSTKAIWKTLVDPAWFESGERDFRIEADTAEGSITLKESKIIIPQKDSSQNTISLTGAWRFSAAGDLPAGSVEVDHPAAVQAAFDDSGWPSILVPHSLGYVDKKWNQYEGILGVYRRTVHLSPAGKNEQIAIVLHSCYWSGRVFINGQEAGQTTGGYLPSRFDITKYVHKGENDIAIIIDNRFSTMGVFKRLNAFYWNWGGLLQEVTIERNADVALIDLRAGGSQSGDLQLWLTAVNQSATDKQKTLSVDVYNPQGKRVLQQKNIKVTLPAGGGIIDTVKLKINHPQLWNLDEPNLYTIIVKGDHLLLKERTGFRDVKASGADLTINGKVIENLQGFDRHADYPGLGRTQPVKLPYQELKELYDKGFRIFRPAHYPTTPAQLDAADELGMLVIEEINVTGLKGAQLATKEVKDFAAQQLTKMIHRDRSHPSIIAWSVGNENLTDEEGAAEYVRDTIQLGRSLDSTRLFTHVTMRATRDKTFEYQDMVAQNYYAGWYTKDVNAISGIVNDVQEYAGNKPILISEYGAEAVIDRQGTGKGTEFYQAFIVDEHNRLLNDRKHFFGKLYWSSTEFWCRPNWTGGNPSPVPPFHVKALQGYYRENNKLGWRVMFSPIRLAFAESAIKKTMFGGELTLAADQKSEINEKVIIREIKGKSVKGTLIILPPLGFKVKADKQVFELQPKGTVTLNISLSGQLPSGLPVANGYIKAVIDEDTEAMPLLLTVFQQEG